MISRAAWPRGPWEGEPDLVYLQADVPSVIIRGPLGALCGYVGVSSGHPWYGVSPQDLYTIKVHGGIDFGSFELFSAPGIRVPDIPPGLYWLGFSTSHAGDLTPATSRDGEYRDLAYVRTECERLVAQAVLVQARKSCNGEHGCSGSSVDPADGLQKHCAACPLLVEAHRHTDVAVPPRTLEQRPLRAPPPDLNMKALTPLGRRMVVVQVIHRGECDCPVCGGRPTLEQLQDAEAAFSEQDLQEIRDALGLCKNTRGLRD